MQQQPEQPTTGNEERKSRRSSRSQKATTTVKRRPKKQEIPAEPAKGAPPRKKKNEALILKHYRLRAIDVKQTEAVVEQRGADTGDVVRKQYERGVLTDTALGAPGEDGLYGLYRGQRLAELLRPDIDGLISFALNQGVVPTVLQEYRQIIAGLNETLQGLRSQIAAIPVGQGPYVPGKQANQLPEPITSTPVTEVSEEADGVLGMFFGGAGESEESENTLSQ
jgi:hypothetical protein